MPKKINRELSRHPERSEGSQKNNLAPWGEVKTLSEQSEHSVLGEGCTQSVPLDMDSPQDFSGHPERSEGSLKEIAQGVDSCETLPVPLRDDMPLRHPEDFREGAVTRSVPAREVPVGRYSAGTPNNPSELVSGSPLSIRERGRGEGATLQPSETNVLPNNEKNSSSYSLNVLSTFQKAAFTLAEVLITLAIIGVVAALTIPSLIENHNEKAWLTAKDLWQKKLVEATRQMNIDGVMTGVAQNTEDYMDIFKKYVKVIKTCDNSKLKNCYSPKIVQTADEEVEVSDLKNSSNLGHDDWGTNTQGFVIADGTTVIMAYNPNCDSVDPFSKEGQSGQVNCMSMLIDVNGKKGPNKVGSDILLSNATISESGCDLQLPGSDLCLAGSDIYPVTPISTCEGEEGHKYDERPDSQNTYCATSYWGGAQKACEDLGMRLPTMQELADIATYIYKQEDNPIGATENRSNITLDSDRASKLGWSIGWSYWSSEPIGNTSANHRDFSSSYSNYRNWHVFNSGIRARCVSN